MPASRADTRSSRLRAAARAWLADDPDPADRAELEAVLRSGDDDDLAGRFASPLTFGTAGIRGAIGAGPARMNRATVRRVSAGLAGYLCAAGPGAGRAGHAGQAGEAGHAGEAGPGPVVIGFDARRRSAEFADEAAAVLTGAGLRVLRLPGPVPTPVLAFAVRHLGASAGVMVTASHNPRDDNGYKVYWADGAQIIPPADAGIAAAAERAGPLREIPLGGPGEELGGEVAAAYLDAIVPAAADGAHRDGARRYVSEDPELFVADPGAPGGTTVGAGRDAPREDAPREARRTLRVAYTPMHGVGGDTLLRAFRRAGFAEPATVAAQFEPDGTFPTLPRPNPEEPGALDLLIEEGNRSGADLILASDPDADRLAVGIPDPAAAGGWRILSGDEIGALLGHHLLAREPDPAGSLLVTTVVSAGLLGQMAAAAGARYAETLTGFKWIMRAAGGQPGSRFLFGYEEALGYAVTDIVRDKDGISAALALADAAARAKRDGGGLAGTLDDITRRFGLYATGQVSLPLSGGVSAEAVLDTVRSAAPRTLTGQPVVATDDLSLGLRSRPDGTKEPLSLPRSDVVIWRCDDGTRVAVRPSGTEPKVKIYLQVVLPAEGVADLAPVRARAARRLADLREEVTEVLDL
jgi:phosphomannomutase